MSQAATKWYPYNLNRNAGNDSLMSPLHYPDIRLMHDTSKIREILIKRPLTAMFFVECEKS